MRAQAGFAIEYNRPIGLIIGHPTQAPRTILLWYISLKSINCRLSMKEGYYICHHTSTRVIASINGALACLRCTSVEEGESHNTTLRLPSRQSASCLSPKTPSSPATLAVCLGDHHLEQWVTQAALSIPLTTAIESSLKSWYSRRL